MSIGIEVIATGARTPLGLTAESTAAAVRASISAFGEFPFVMANGEPVIVCADPQLESALEGRARLVALIESVLDEVLQKLEQGSPHTAVGVICCSRCPKHAPDFRTRRRMGCRRRRRRDSERPD